MRARPQRSAPRDGTLQGSRFNYDPLENPRGDEDTERRRLMSSTRFHTQSADLGYSARRQP
jgi:hypothetical protein